MKKAAPPDAKGNLFIVATPIGNLADISFRAIEVLKQVDLIAAEDTRHAGLLLSHYAITKPLTSFHEFNEKRTASALIRRLAAGESVALISDAGTPLINDPGFPLVRMAGDAGFNVSPIPGCCALIAALSVSGLATDRFSFEGFPPRNGAARRSCFETLLDNPRTLIFYESGHRILESVHDLTQVFPGTREIVIARELTKLHETLVKTTLANVDSVIQRDAHIQKGELVVLLEGAQPRESAPGLLRTEDEQTLRLLLNECSVKTAVSLAAQLTGVRKKILYQAALRMRGAGPDRSEK